MVWFCFVSYHGHLDDRPLADVPFGYQTGKQQRGDTALTACPLCCRGQTPPLGSLQATGPFLQQTGDPVAAQQLALQTLANLRQQQASALAYFDVFWVLAVVMVALVFVVLLMKRSVAEKGARIGGE